MPRRNRTNIKPQRIKGYPVREEKTIIRLFTILSRRPITPATGARKA